MEKINCSFGTAKKLMIHEINNRITLVTHFESETIKCYKDGVMYNELDANINLFAFEALLARTIEESKQLLPQPEK